MIILGHIHYNTTPEEDLLIQARASTYLAQGTTRAVAYNTALEEFLSHHMPNNVHLVMAEVIE